VTAPTARPRPSRLGRSLAVTAVLLMVAMWGYVVYLAFGPGRADPPDRLDDPGFAVAAQARCDQALDRIAALQPASQAPTAAARADVLDVANADLADMLADLEAIQPDGEDGVIVGRWLVDWHTYLADREDYADRLREDEEARLLVSPKKGQQVTEFLDAFAKDNDMPACSTPSDAG
jgi:hypothetical protein